MSIKRVEIKKLKANLFVRQSLNQEHVIYLGELIENKIKLPPIRITPDGTIIDGRHRVEAYELNDFQEIEAEVVEVESEVDIIALAYQANVGGSLPPTPKDTEHTITTLLERGETKKRIAELLGLPISMTRKYLENIQVKIGRKKLARAIEAVTEGGLTAAKAAEQHGVGLEKLREALSGQKNKRKWGMVEVQRNLTRSYRSLSQKNACLLRSLREKFEDGDVTLSQIAKIIAHINSLQKRSSRAISDWEKRFKALESNKA